MGHSKFHAIPGDLTPPMDTYLHVSRREVNQNPVTNSGQKQGLVVLAAQAYQYGDEASCSRLYAFAPSLWLL